MNLTTFPMLQQDISVIEKAAAGQDWVVNQSLHNSSTNILPEGVFELRQDITIQNIVNLATELDGVAINAGDAFIVENGGEYFGTTVRDNDVIVALESPPSLLTTSTDWLVVSNGSGTLTNDQAAFFNQVTRTNNRFDLSENVFVNDDNVQISANTATGTGLGSGLAVNLVQQEATQQTLDLGTQNIQFSSLIGGNLRLSVVFQANSFSGFLPDLQTLRLTYGSTVFSFPLTNISPDGGTRNVDITIPTVDYTAILNTDPTIELIVNFSGASFIRNHNHCIISQLIKRNSI